MLISGLNALPPDSPRILLSTGRLIGEGFDHPPLDTLILAMPVSWKGRYSSMRDVYTESIPVKAMSGSLILWIPRIQCCSECGINASGVIRRWGTGLWLMVKGFHSKEYFTIFKLNNLSSRVVRATKSPSIQASGICFSIRLFIALK